MQKPDKELADGSFIESSSGSAARELKRRYDQLAGVGPSLRSPYAITAFVNQHGKSMYRLGYVKSSPIKSRSLITLSSSFRDENSAPAASAAEVGDRMCHASDSSHSPRTKRRSRLSMHFLPPAIFTKGNSPLHQLPGRASATSTASKKLHRKIRSIPDLVSAAMGEQSEQSGTSGPTFAVTGRGHSQSVTAVDSARSSLAFQPLPPKTDSFGELLDLGPMNNSVRSITISTDPGRPRATVLQPFGPGVQFNVPSKKGAADRLRPPRQLREMQSFESSMTARQDDVSVEVDESQEPEHELNRPPSAIRLSQIAPLVEPVNNPESTPEPTSELDETISPQSLQYSSQYSIEVFNVLQKYSGLPVFESLVPEVDEGTTVIKLSLSMDANVAPRDDPRFVIWGEIQPEHDFDDYSSVSRDSLTDISPSHAASSLSRRSLKTQKLKSPEASLSSIFHQEKPQRVLLAATIERWLAQLTSDLDYDELLVFFLTYRSCISAVDLCHLFICRFHWALLKATSREDETVRRFVRVRTFVAIRYWMLTFFTVDFIPNRDLRLLISDWLNTLLHDPVLQKHMDGFVSGSFTHAVFNIYGFVQGIVRRLIKIAKDCKKAHTKSTDKPSVSFSRPSTDSVPDHVLGKSFAKAIQKTNDVESDLDLDFLTNDIANDLPAGFRSDPSNAHLAHLTTGNGPGAGTVVSQPRPTSFARSSLPFIHHADRTSVPNGDPETFNHGQASAARHNTLTRAFVRTIGRLGRWKRVFQPRSPAASVTPLVAKGSTVSAFDLKINAPAELMINRNVEDYLKVAQPSIGLPNTSSFVVDKQSVALPRSPPLLPLSPATITNASYSSSVTLGTHSTEPSQESPPSPESPLVSHSALPSHPTLLHNASLPSPPPSPIQSIPEAISPLPAEVLEPEYSDVPSSNIATNWSPSHAEREEVNGSRQVESFCSSSTDSFGVPLTSDGPLPPTFSDTRTPWQFDIVSIDDLDFSDTSSLPGGEEPLQPPGLRKQRKLPMRRDFEFVRHSQVSSMGIVSHPSMRDSIGSSACSGTSPTSSTGTGPKAIQRWQMKSLQQTFEDMNNSGNEKGDVEAALRRLEGQINPEVLQENAEKVNGWVRNLQERMAVGDYECSVYSEEIEDFVDEVDAVPAVEDQEAQAMKAEDGTNHSHIELPAHTSVPTRTMHQLPTPPNVDISPIDMNIESAVPAEVLQNRMSTAPTLVANPTPPLSKLGSEALQVNTSFIHGYASEQLAQHFTMIDRELFMSVRFEELVTGEWLDCEEMDILDWTQYLKDRARWKAESRCTHMSTALAALRARFNLTVAFVNAEVVLAPPSERLFVVSKFIWIAWVSLLALILWKFISDDILSIVISLATSTH